MTCYLPSVTDVVSRDVQHRGIIVPIAKRERARQIAYGVVLEPRSEADPDLQADFYSADDVEKAAHGFLANAVRNTDAASDVMHDSVSKAGYPVESFIAPVDFILGDQSVRKGSWVLGMHYPDANVWKRITDGELGAFSVGGSGMRD